MEKEKTERSVVVRAFWTEAYADTNTTKNTNELLKNMKSEGLARIEEVTDVSNLIQKMRELMKNEWYMNYALCQNGSAVDYTRDYSIAKKFLDR